MRYPSWPSLAGAKRDAQLEGACQRGGVSKQPDYAVGARHSSEPERLRWLWMPTVGLMLIVVAALVRGAPGDLVWYGGQIGFGLLLLAVGRLELVRRVYPTVLAAAVVVAAVIAASVAVADSGAVAGSPRLALWAGNPNTLGAYLVVALVCYATRPKQAIPLPLVLVAVTVGVLLTGSRTALAALVLASAALVCSRAMGRQGAATIGLTAIAVGAFFAYAALDGAQDARAGPNLLLDSTTFGSRVWRVYGDASVEVVIGAAEGPLPGTNADRIKSQPGQTLAVLIQHSEVSIQEVPYVASVYLRASVPQKVAISTHLSRETCLVVDTWTRCATPPGFGNGRLGAQFRLEAQGAADAFDVFAFGPQLERALSPTAYVERGDLTFAPFLSVYAERLAGSFSALGSRVPVMAAFLGAAGSSLLAGSGLSAPPVSVDGRTAYSHAHNLVIDRLYREGILGLAGWALISAPLLMVSVRRAGRRTAPLLVALVVLNTFDVSIFSVGVFVPVLIFIAGHLPPYGEVG